MKNTITLQFEDSDDLKNFKKYIKMAKEHEGTVESGLYTGLMCSALKHSKAIKSPDDILLEAYKDYAAVCGDNLEIITDAIIKVEGKLEHR